MVHAERGIIANHGRQTRKPGPAVRRAMNCRLLAEQITTAILLKSPDQDGNEGDGYDDRLGHEEPTQVVRMHVEERDLGEPEEEEADHCVGCYALGSGDVVGQREE